MFGSIAPSRASTIRARARGFRDRGARGGDAGAVEQVRLVEDDHVGAEHLILEDFLERIVVIDGRIVRALPRERLGIVRETALDDRRAVHHGDDAVHRQMRADGRPVERLHQRLWQRETRRLDEDVIRARLAREQRLHRRHEIVRDRAAQAAVGQFDDVLFRAGFDAAAAQNLAVDADIAELVDDEREPPPLHVLQNMADRASSCRRPGSR